MKKIDLQGKNFPLYGFLFLPIYFIREMRLNKLKVFFLTGNFFFLWSLSPDQTLVERELKVNKYFLKFINVGVSNFGTQKNIEQLKEANQRDFNAHLWYMQGDYPRAYKELRASREILKDLYLDMVENRYIEDAKALLDLGAPIIIRSQDKKAQAFLRLGYRDLESAREYVLMGKNYNKFLFTNKIAAYIQAIKRLRRAKRYAFLALIEANTPLEDKPDYKTQTLDEYIRREEIKKEREQLRLPDYQRVKNLLTNLIERRLLEDTYNFFLHHDDNYGYISKEKESILEKFNKELSAKEIMPEVGPQWVGE